MDSSLILSHLPRAYAYHRSLSSLRERDQAPEAGEIADTLCSTGANKREVWETIHAARRLADLTNCRLGRGMSVVSFWSMYYPHSLRLIAQPPWNVFYVGRLPAQVTTLAVVGARRPDEYGIRLVSDILPRLKTRPLQVMSGLAYGIDSLAHHYACESGIPNFAVLGSGADILYPHEHADLAGRILAGEGGILSEFPPGTQPIPMNFPRRNRIISGLADVVWIVQGTARSGSLHTARAALDQAKVIASCPGDIYSELSLLPNRLLFEGAQVILEPDDLDLLLAKPAATITH